LELFFRVTRAGAMRAAQTGFGLVGQLRLRFSQVRTATLVQKTAPRKITGARNVTRKAVRSNGTIELSQSTVQCEPEMQQDARAW